jgi:hypothetical protein
MQHPTEESKSKSYLCTECYFCCIDGAQIECEKGYFKPIAIKKATVYTPIDFDCWEYEIENNNKY